MDINVEDYRDLAFKHINALPPNKRKGIEEEDLLQAAYTGIFLASKKYDEKKTGSGGFVSFCYWYIMREINKFAYDQTTNSDGKCVLKPKITDKLLEDVIEVDLDDSTLLSMDEDKDQSLFVEQFLESFGATLKPLERNYFMDLYFLGETTASRRYVNATGNTFARSQQVRKKVKEAAAKHLEKLER